MTNYTLGGALNRRDVVKAAGFAGLGMAGVRMIAGTSTAHAIEAAAPTDGTPSFMVAPEPITSVVETKEYDVVVVGAGASGLAAAIRAAEDGARVAVVQKLGFASSQGFEASGLLSDKNDEATKQAFVSTMMGLCDYRPKRELLDAWAHNSGDAIMWYRGILDAAGVEQEAEADGSYEKDCNGYTAVFMTARPSATFAGAVDGVAGYAETLGVEFFYDTPAVQLVREDGGVTGVIAGKEGAYTRFGASRGVILATGDYQCNQEMIGFYCPDVLGFPPLEVGRDGDGHRMGVWVGGRLEPIGHTKMIHESWSNNAPFLMVDAKGERFSDEHVPWFKVNTLLRDTMKAREGDLAPAEVYSIADAKYKEQMQEWQAIDAEIKVKDWPETSVEEGGYQFAWEAQTIEELADLIGMDPTVLGSTVERYNELVDAGADEDFGKDARFLAKLDTPPYYAVMRDFVEGLSAMLGGLVVDADQRVLGEDDEPIRGLFAVGNVSGPFFGSIDYPMYFPGISVGRAITTGYIAGAVAAHA